MKSYPLVSSYLVLLMACASASAQQVYRCGNSYSQQPCGPDAKAIQTDDPRTDAQRAAAQQGFERDKTLLKEMEASRHKEETRALSNMKAEQAAQARKASADQKREDRKAQQATASAKSKKTAGLRTVKVQEPGTFTVASGHSAPKKNKAKTKAKGSAP